MTRLIAVLVLTLAVGGCTTTAIVHTMPPGANLFVGGRYVGKTPVAVELKDGMESAAGTSAKLELKGYRSQFVMLEKSWSVGYIMLDVLLCFPTLGLACYLIYFNGKTHDSEYHFPLLEEEQPVNPAPPPAAAVPLGTPNS